MEKGEFYEKIQILREMSEAIDVAGGTVLSAAIKDDDIVLKNGRAIQIQLCGDDPEVMYALANDLGVPVVESDNCSGKYRKLTVCTEDAEICLLVSKENAG